MSVIGHLPGLWALLLAVRRRRSPGRGPPVIQVTRRKLLGRYTAPCHKRDMLLSRGSTVMLAEIFMLRIEAMERVAAADKPNNSGSNTRFVPVTLPSAQQQQPSK